MRVLNRNSGGATQSGLRDHNVRLILSTIRADGPMPGSDLARRTALSAQTVSVILRDLERDGLLKRGDPVRGKVGKPRVPMALAASGCWGIGLKIGRRTADLALMDLRGTVHRALRLTYRYPMPEEIFTFLRDGLVALEKDLPPESVARIAGLGLAAPFEIWRWHDVIGAPASEFAAWRDVDFAAEIRKLTELPVIVMNDATAACRAEHHLGGPLPFRDYAYFFVGAFIGGGVVLNRAVIDGNLGNAGALGSLVATGPAGRPVQLLDIASLHLLEAAIERSGKASQGLWTEPLDWRPFESELDAWIKAAAPAMAQAALSAVAVIDFGAVVIDGAFPAQVRERLTAAIRQEIGTLDTRGLIRPKIVEGQVGRDARVRGAAYAPISAQCFLDGLAPA